MASENFGSSQRTIGRDDISGMSITEFVLVVYRQRKLVLGLPLLSAAIVYACTFVLPDWYTAKATILPPQQQQSSTLAILGQLGGFGTGPTQALGLKNPNDLYVSMLKSRTLADRVIARFNLKAVYGESLLVAAREELQRNTRIYANRDGIIGIEVDDKDPQRAAAIANAYVEELRGLSANLAVSEAAQRRVFFENQLQKSRNDLAASEVALKQFTQREGLINPQGQISLSVSAAASLRAQITAKEIQLSAMRTFGTDSHPDIKRVVQELTGLRAELAKMERNTNNPKGDVLVSFAKAPDVELEYIRRYREMKYFETLFEVLAKHYEIARIDEAKDAGLVQVLDDAIVPERRSKPNRMLIVLSTLLIVAATSVFIALLTVRRTTASQH